MGIGFHDPVCPLETTTENTRSPLFKTCEVQFLQTLVVQVGSSRVKVMIFHDSVAQFLTDLWTSFGGKHRPIFVCFERVHFVRF